MVARRTDLDPDRTQDMKMNEMRMWDLCGACHKELGTPVYRLYLAKRIERFERMACSGDATISFIALR